MFNVQGSRFNERLLYRDSFAQVRVVDRLVVDALSGIELYFIRTAAEPERRNLFSRGWLHYETVCGKTPSVVAPIGCNLGNSMKSHQH